MIALSDADRANIAAAWVGCAFGNAGARAIQAAAEDTYRAGIAAGIERSAKAIASLDGWQEDIGVKLCTAAIRALNAPAVP
jgi:hypothetical protein